MLLLGIIPFDLAFIWWYYILHLAINLARTLLFDVSNVSLTQSLCSSQTWLQGKVRILKEDYHHVLTLMMFQSCVPSIKHKRWHFEKMCWSHFYAVAMNGTSGFKKECKAQRGSSYDLWSHIMWETDWNLDCHSVMTFQWAVNCCSQWSVLRLVLQRHLIFSLRLVITCLCHLYPSETHRKKVA